MTQHNRRSTRGESPVTRLATHAAGMAVASVLLAQTAPYGMTAVAAETLAPPRAASDDHRRGPESFADLAEKVAPAVISVSTKVAAPGRLQGSRRFHFGAPGGVAPGEEDQDIPQEVPAPRDPDQGGQDRSEQDHVGPQRIPQAELTTVGSGFFISADGYAVTNSHVVEDGDVADVRTTDGKTYTARVIGKDPLSDLALIKVDGRNDFTYATIADRPPRVGDWVLAVGNSFGLGVSVMRGIISARERKIPQASPEGFLQIDAPINKGDSGGPSFDTDGNVIGVNSMIFSPSGGSVGVAFAVPADTIKQVVPQLRDKGTVTRGSIGVMVQTLTPDLADGLGRSGLHGAIVAGLQRDSPAAKAGLAKGDVITSIGGRPVKDADELAKKIRDMAPGSSVRLGLFRHGKDSSVSVAIVQLENRNASATVGRGAR